jgi:hypothetical protein
LRVLNHTSLKDYNEAQEYPSEACHIRNIKVHPISIPTTTKTSRNKTIQIGKGPGKKKTINKSQGNF